MNSRFGLVLGGEVGKVDGSMRRFWWPCDFSIQNAYGNCAGMVPMDLGQLGDSGSGDGIEMPIGNRHRCATIRHT